MDFLDFLMYIAVAVICPLANDYSLCWVGLHAIISANLYIATEKHIDCFNLCNTYLILFPSLFGFRKCYQRWQKLYVG